MTNPPADDANKDANAQHADTDKGEVTDGQSAAPPDVPDVPRVGQSPETFWAKNAVALAGIAATLIAACFAAFLTYQTSKDNIAAERERSSVEFQRAERKSAYSDFLTKALMLEGVEMNVNSTRYSRPLQPDQQSIEALKQSQAESDEWQAAKDQLVTAAAAVDLVGSGNVRLRASDLRDVHNEVETANLILNTEYMRSPSNQQAVDAAVKEFESKRSDAANARFEFSKAASESLGISLLGP
jgi:hypothetical protein